jgi:CheY-like chemotaxis protein
MPQNDKHILVVDDDPRNRKLLEAFLLADGYAVRACDSGAKALRAVAEQRPDAILLDAMMPDMDGFETVRRLRAQPETRAIPVLMVTALDDAASRQRLASAGIDGILTKPIDRWQLKAKLQQITQARAPGEEGGHA